MLPTNPNNDVSLSIYIPQTVNEEPSGKVVKNTKSAVKSEENSN